MNKKDNSRSRATDERIIRAMYEVLDKKKSIAKVTVREICELAGINRSTFYAHYVDVYDLLEKVEKEMERSMTEAFLEQIQVGSDISKCFVSMFEFIREYRQFFEIYLNEASHPVIGLARNLYKSKLDTVDPKDFGYTLFENEFEYHEAFALAGMTAIIRLWLADGCRLSPEQLMGVIAHHYSPNRELFMWDD